MIISLRLKNFYSLRDDAVLDFTASMGTRKERYWLAENLLDFKGDKFVNIIGLFGSNAAGKSNMIKALDWCRNFILNSHLNNEGDKLDYVPFKFGGDSASEFYIDFVADGVEYEYSYELNDGIIQSEHLYYYPGRRKSRIFSRVNRTEYSYGKGLIQRPKEIESATGDRTLFLSRASSMNRELAQVVYRFFREKMIIGIGETSKDLILPKKFESVKPMLLEALEVSDSDIIDIRVKEYSPGAYKLVTYHRENPDLPFDFELEESDGTKRLIWVLLRILDKVAGGAAIFIDEFDLRLHLLLAEFLLNIIREGSGAQLVFTSHNPALLNIGHLRHEQIVFVTKNLYGGSEFVPLSDYIGLRSDLDIGKAYLQGRFDGIPYIGDTGRVLMALDSGDEGKKI